MKITVGGWTATVAGDPPTAALRSPDEDRHRADALPGFVGDLMEDYAR